MKTKQFGYASLTALQIKLLGKAVKGKRVLDLGCGDMSLSKECARLGASMVTGVDKAPPPMLSPWPERVIYWQEYFEDVASDLSRIGSDEINCMYQVGLLSWPVNWEAPGLLRVVDQLPMIIYVGRNTAGTTCGTPSLFERLVQRDLLAYVAEPLSTMIVIGRPLREPRTPTYEEKSGIRVREMVIMPWVDEEPFFAPTWEVKR